MARSGSTVAFGKRSVAFIGSTLDFGKRNVALSGFQWLDFFLILYLRFLMGGPQLTRSGRH